MRKTITLNNEEYVIRGISVADVEEYKKIKPENPNADDKIYEILSDKIVDTPDTAENISNILGVEKSWVNLDKDERLRLLKLLDVRFVKDLFLAIVSSDNKKK